jgi:hypothetical protein
MDEADIESRNGTSRDARSVGMSRKGRDQALVAAVATDTGITSLSRGAVREQPKLLAYDTLPGPGTEPSYPIVDVEPTLPASGRAVTIAPSRTPDSTPWLSLRMSGTSGWLVSSQQAFGGGLEADSALAPQWTMGVHLWSELPRRKTAEAGEVSASVHALGTHLRFTPLGLVRAGPELTIGLRLEAIAASGHGYEESRSRLLLNPSLWGTVGWRHPLSRQLFVTPSLGVAMRPRRENLVVKELGTVLALSPVSIQAGLGVGWAIF